MQGRIGKINLLKADFGINIPFDPDHRLYNKQLIGGSLLDLGIYPLFLSLLLLGKPKTIRAMAGIGDTGVDYNCSFTLGYEEEHTGRHVFIGDGANGYNGFHVW